MRPHDCIDDRELEDCDEGCQQHPEYRQQDHNYQCEEDCAKICQYVTENAVSNSISCNSFGNHY